MSEPLTRLRHLRCYHRDQAAAASPKTGSTRWPTRTQELIHDMLVSLRDVRQQARLEDERRHRDNHRDRSYYEAKILWFDRDYHSGSFRELEILLGWLGDIEPVLYRHVMAYYVNATYVPKLREVKGVVPEPDGTPVREPVMTIRRDPASCGECARLGIAWIETEWDAAVERAKERGKTFRPPQLPVRKDER